MPNLTIRANGSESVFVIEDEQITIGRAPHNDVSIQDGLASKEHARIRKSASGWTLVDLESHNGTKVNGAFANKKALEHGDTIQIGKTELRFALEGAARAKPTHNPRTPVDDADAPPPPRRPRPSKTGQNAVIFGGAILGVVLLIAFTGSFTSGIRSDDYNEQVFEQTKRLISNGELEKGRRYFEENADPSGAGYARAVERVAELTRRRPKIESVHKENEAAKVMSRMANKIANYHRGGTADPDVILQMMQRLKSEYAGTQTELDAARLYPEWYAGGTPERERDRTDPRRKLQKEWDAICEQADGYRKKEQFREARETLERFVRVRESTLDDFELTWLQGELKKRVGNIDRLASTYFSSVERRVFDLVKKKRYDQAIELYRGVITNYGIDQYVRRAKEGIREVEEARRTESTKAESE